MTHTLTHAHTLTGAQEGSESHFFHHSPDTLSEHEVRDLREVPNKDISLNLFSHIKWW